jgi:hypothetical protein
VAPPPRRHRHPKPFEIKLVTSSLRVYCPTQDRSGSTVSIAPDFVLLILLAVHVMRVLAMLSLFFGFATQLIPAGQPLSSAVLGIVCGGIAIACGLRVARVERSTPRDGWILVVLGLALGLWCVIMVPSAYRYHEKINGRSEQRQSGTANNTVRRVCTGFSSSRC